MKQKFTLKQQRKYQWKYFFNDLFIYLFIIHLFLFLWMFEKVVGHLQNENSVSDLV